MLLVYPIAFGYVATHASRAAVPAPTLGPHREDVAFTTADGLTLRGWYVPSRNGAAVIVSPGRSAAVQRHAALFARHRYGVLVFDRRGEGKSEGDPNLYGWSGNHRPGGRRAISRPRGPTSTATASEGSACPSAARCSSRRPRNPRHCGQSSPKARASARFARQPGCLGPRLVATAVFRRRHDGDRALRRRGAAAWADAGRRPDRAAPGLLHLRRSRPGRRGAQPDVLLRCAGAQAALEDPGGRTYRGSLGTSAPVRATCRRLLRPRAGEIAVVEDAQPLDADELRLIDAYWRAANYLSVGQIYLLDNPLLREPLRSEHVKPRLLGHFGTTPGLNLIWVHLNRAIRARQLHAIYVTGPGHGGPGIVANAYLEGTYSELYPNVGPGEDGLRELFRQFSFPGGIPSHAAPETPGSIHEGGELGYALAHAYGAAYDNPDLLVCCVVGDGEAETGPLATSWHSNKFLNPVTDGAVLPVLHLNGYKIANPTVLARIPEQELVALMEGYGHRPLLVSGDDPEAVHQELRRRARRRARRHLPDPAGGARGPGDRTAALADDRAAHAEGLDGPEGGRRQAGRGNVALAPGADVGCPRQQGSRPAARGVDAQLPAGGALRRARSARPGTGRAGAGGRAAHEREPARERRRPPRPRPPRLPRLRGRREVTLHGLDGGHSRARHLSAGRDRPQPGELPPLRPRRDRVQPPRRRLRGDGAHLGSRDRADGRGPRAGRPRDGGALGAPLPGLAGGLPADRQARALQLLRGVHPHHRLDVQPACEVAEGHARHPVAAADRVAQLPAQLARLAPGPQRVLAPGSRLHRPRREQEGGGDPGLPAAGREHAPLRGRPLPAQPALRERDRRRQAACARLPADRGRDRPLHARASGSGSGPRATRAASRTS